MESSCQHYKGGLLNNPENNQVHFINEGILINKIVWDARNIIGLPDELWELAFGEMRSVLLNIINQNRKPEDLKELANIFMIQYTKFVKEVYNQAKMYKSTNEIEPFTAALIGAGAGAAIRHWSKSSEHEMLENTSFELNDDLISILSPFRNSTMLPSEVYKKVIEVLRDKPEIVKGFTTGISITIVNGANEDFGLSAATIAFLAGLTAGAKAYDGKL